MISSAPKRSNSSENRSKPAGAPTWNGNRQSCRLSTCRDAVLRLLRLSMQLTAIGSTRGDAPDSEQLSNAAAAGPLADLMKPRASMAMIRNNSARITELRALHEILAACQPRLTEIQHPSNKSQRPRGRRACTTPGLSFIFNLSHLSLRPLPIIARTGHWLPESSGRAQRSGRER